MQDLSGKSVLIGKNRKEKEYCNFFEKGVDKTHEICYNKKVVRV